MSTATANKQAAGNGAASQNGDVTHSITAGERRLLAALRAARNGDFSVRLPIRGSGTEAEIAKAFNEVVETKTRMLNEIKRVSRSISRDGRLSLRASLEGASGDWQAHIEAYNSLIETVAAPMAETNRVLGAVAQGDLSQRMTVEIDGHPLRGDFLKSAKVINAMV